MTYSTADLYKLAESYGEQGRRDYVRVRYTFDLVWPLVYGFFLLTALGWLSVIAVSEHSKWRSISSIPILGVVFDYLENISTSIVMVRYPVRTVFLDVMATFFTPVKWIFVGANFCLLVIFGIIALGKQIKNIFLLHRITHRR